MFLQKSGVPREHTMNDQELKKIFNAKKQRTVKGKIQAGFIKTTFDDFRTWFCIDTFSSGCHYCGTTNETSNKLFQMQRTGMRVDATRGGKRGNRLELDRLNPFGEYDNLNNIVWCCYWCNNAKSNFFNAEEFMPIGEKIGEVINNIIKRTEEK